MADDATSPVAPGSLLAGKYRVQKVLGAGGMGVVVAAIHEELHQQVAVKFLHPSALGHSEATERFLREARAAVRIQSENVARVIDVGRLDNGAPYMVMEYLDGQDLAARIREGRVAVPEAVGYVVQACAAMVEAHTVGIVHRDLKPANLFLSRRSDGSVLVKVLDFGISKLRVAGASDPSLTKTSAMMGSPFYMSPEQMRSSKTVDCRTDIWALGVILYELLAGRTAFRGETLPEVVASIMTEDPHDLSQLRPDAPQALVQVVQRCLNKDPTRRFQSVAELACALGPFAGKEVQHLIERISRAAGLPVTSPVAAPEPTGTVALQATDTNWADTQQPSLRRGPKLLLAVFAIALALAGLSWFALRMPAASETEPTAAPLPEPAAAKAPQAPNPREVVPQVQPVEQVVPAASAAQAPSQTPNRAATKSATLKSAVKRASAQSVANSSAKKKTKPEPLPHKLEKPATARTAHPEPVISKPEAKEKNPLAIDLK